MLKDSKSPKTKVTFSLDRCKALADGVFAIAVSFVSVQLSGLLFVSIPLYYLSHRAIEQDWSHAGKNEE